MNFMFERQEQYVTSEYSERVRYCFCHEDIKFISFRHRVMFFLLYRLSDDGVFEDFRPLFPKILDCFDHTPKN